MNNNQYDNKVSNSFMQIIGTLIRMFERAFVTLFDGLRNAVEAGTHPMVGLATVVSTFVAPAPVAVITSLHLMEYFEWELWLAVTVAIAFELAGYVIWVNLATELIEKGWKFTTMNVSFILGMLVYQISIFLINSVLGYLNGAPFTNSFILALLGLLPAIAGLNFGYRNQVNQKAINSRKRKEEAKEERRYQEAREDKKQARQFAKDTNMPELFNGNRRPKVTRLCGCGCGESFTTSVPEKLYINNAHKQEHYRQQK